MDEILELDPTTHLCRLNEEFRSLAPEVQHEIREATYMEFQNLIDAGGFPKKVAELVNRFGHLSDNGNDFSAVPWRERPELVLQLVMDFEPTREDRKKITLRELETNGQAGYLIKFFYKRAREFRLLREQISGLYTHGYGLFRYYFLALGRHFVQRSLIDEPEDIFYLSYDQVRNLVQKKDIPTDLHPEIARHKADMDRYRDILVPTVIYGDEIPPVREPNMEALFGIPTSIGHHTGRVKVVRGIEDFPKVFHGDVLVIPYSDVGWTPLFARAGAVIAESGGLLSHSSIVAREYNIPAVVSVEGATFLPDETLVTVDGHKGEILIYK
jgi:pyruvate,water dikinase